MTKSLILVLLLSGIETLIVFSVVVIAYVLEFPQKGLLEPINKYGNVSALSMILRGSIFMLMARFIVLNIPLNIIAQYLALRSTGLNISIFRVTYINFGCFALSAIAISLLMPSTREMWIVGRPLHSHVWMPALSVACIVSPLILIKALKYQ